MDREILQACKELIDDAKMGCADLVFKEICLEILSKARLVLPEKQFRSLVAYASKRMREKFSLELGQELVASK
ncbi:MAG: hypothetical protein RMJ15_09205 [Nitrososphaerota archaeon]|nr:hypothetical protein [Candidatus Bathyarchaeota archaeon]MDW8023893.1 hypothetical protein [Nitrososphaerota archaeon]